MAINSKREQIIVYEAARIATLDSIKTVVRKQQSYGDLQQFGLPQFPVAALLGKLPQPVRKMSQRLPANVDLFLSRLATDVYVYVQDNVNPDTTVSSIADDLWALFQQDLTLGGLTKDLELALDENVEFWEPFTAIHLTLTAQYLHYAGGI